MLRDITHVKDVVEPGFLCPLSPKGPGGFLWTPPLGPPPVLIKGQFLAMWPGLPH